MSDSETQSSAVGILFYDGDCGLCTRSVRFFLHADKAARLRFAPLQGETAKEHLPADLRDASCLSTVVYLRGDTAKPEPLVRSEAVCQALIDLGGLWAGVGRCLRAIPKPWRESGYAFIARHRMKIFPKGACPLPSPEAKKRMLD